MWTWICVYLMNKSTYICMVGASTYYFSANKDTQGKADICLGFKWAYGKNLGSLALGSLVIPFLTVARYLIDKQRRGADCGIFACIGSCLKCFLFCISTQIDYVGKNGFAFLVISGDDFFKSCWYGFLINL